MRILITGGGCREYIDSVRFVTNSSTGRTSAKIADELSSKGNEITLITAESAIRPDNHSVRTLTFRTGGELSEAIEKELASSPYDAVIHAAAVSDFIPDTITVGEKSMRAGKNTEKIPSGTEMTLTFKASPKIADSLRAWARKGGKEKVKIICFKLLNNADESEKDTAVSNLLARSKADMVVYNDLSKITAEEHPFKIFDGKANLCGEGKTNVELAEEIMRLLA